VTRWLAYLTVICLVVTGQPGRGRAQSLVDLVTRATPSVAFVLSKDENGQPLGGGTAFVIGPGVLLTALHVVQEANQVSVALPGQSAVEADVVGIDIEHDLAVLHALAAPQPGPTPLALGNSTGIQLGQAIAVVGYPLPSPEHPTVTVTQGIVSALRTQQGFIQIDASVNPGNSGGPVLAPDGRVIGVVDASIRGAQNFNFAVPIDFAKPLLEHARANTPLPLPLTSSKSLTLSHSGSGIGPGEHEERDGVSCVAPPPNAALLTEVRVDLNVQKPLHMLAWLSWERGAPPDYPNTFAKINDGVPPQLIRPLTNLEFQPDTVCLNYLAFSQTGSGGSGGRTFAVTYTLVYKVFNVPSTTTTSQ